MARIPMFDVVGKGRSRLDRAWLWSCIDGGTNDRSCEAQRREEERELHFSLFWDEIFEQLLYVVLATFAIEFLTKIRFMQERKC